MTRGPRTRGPSVRLCRIGRPLRHIAVLRAGEVALRRSCVWYVRWGAMLLTERGGCGRPIGLLLVSSSWCLRLLVCAFHPFYRSLSQSYHEFQLPSRCSYLLQVRPFEYRPLRCLFPYRFLRLCFLLRACSSCRVSSDTHTLIHGYTSA